MQLKMTFSLSDVSFERWNLTTIIFVLLVLTVGCIAIRQSLLPKLYPGIPHHPLAGRRILGDLPRLISHAKTSGGQVLDWMAQQCLELDSAVVQIAVKPFCAPFILIDDHATAEDILSRRTPREFDRAQESEDMLGHLVPHSTIVMRSTEKFKAQRSMWTGTMSPAFLNRVAVPATHSVFGHLVELWAIKAQLAKGRPFEAGEDIKMSTLDLSWAVANGSELGSVQAHIDLLSTKSEIDLNADTNSPAIIPRAELPPLAQAIYHLVGTVNSFNPFPRLKAFYLNLLPSFRKAQAIKDKNMALLLANAREKFANHQDEIDEHVTSAMDYVVGKEEAAQERAALFGIGDQHLKDEAFLFLLGGQETLSTSLQWFLKYLARNQDKQQKLYDSLAAALPLDFSPADLVQANIPYLDAFVHEVMRVSRTAPGVMRQAKVDTQVLGIPIPKGANVLLSLQHDSFMVDEDTAKPPVPKHEGYRPLDKHWALKGRRNFDPSRWLTTLDGKEVFDPNAGPSLPFSAGTRGCFGKRLGLAELRTIVAVLGRRLHFDLVPESLDSDKASEVITRIPIHCYVKPRSVG